MSTICLACQLSIPKCCVASGSVTEKLAEKSRKKWCALFLSFGRQRSQSVISPQPSSRFPSSYLHSNRIDMVYTSPTKKCRAIEWNKRGMGHKDIAQKLGIHRTTVLRLIKRFINFPDYYHIEPKTGRPRVMNDRSVRIAGRMIARDEVHNATELQKKAFKDVSTRTLQRRLKEHGFVCRVKKKKPYLNQKAKEARRQWAMAHVDWTVEDCKRVIFSDESKYMLFKSDGREYAWFRKGEQYEAKNIKKTVKHGGGHVMVWGCVTREGMGELHRVVGNMNAEDYVAILNKNMPKTLKKHKLKLRGPTAVFF